MQSILLFTILIITGLLIYSSRKKKTPLSQPEIDVERQILEQNVLFYSRLNAQEKLRFEDSLRIFLKRVKITGIKTMVEDMDKVFIAASAIIPVFAFRGWEYKNIHEVLLYPDSFTQDYKQEGEGRNTLGMVGNGAMSNVMILSQQDLRNGFFNKTDTSNTAIHEFVHLVDNADKDTDGEPRALLPDECIKPWLKRMHYEIQQIKEGASDINPYGATNEAEFLAVASEYFFEQPEKMQQKHPELYAMLEKIFMPANP